MLLDRQSCRTVVAFSQMIVTTLFISVVVIRPSEANPDAKRLYDDLLSHYNRLIRPVSNNSEVVTVRLGLHLSQLIDLVSFFFPNFAEFPSPANNTTVYTEDCTLFHK